MKVGLNTYGYTYRESVLDTIPRLARTAGVDNFEILASPGHCWPRSAAERRELAAVINGEGVEVSALNLRASDHNLVSDYSDAQALALSHYRMLATAAAAARIPYIVVVPGRTSSILSETFPILRDRFIKVIRDLNAQARDEGVGILLENVPLGFLGDTDSLVRMVEELGEPNINIVLDAANAAFLGEDFRRSYERAADFVRMVHLSNTTTNKLKHNVFDAGTAPITDILRFICQYGRVEYVNVEVVGDESEIISNFRMARSTINNG
ncbi:MAG: sugar phosphate isomerase/epimerase [Mesorhizobium sp.]